MKIILITGVIGSGKDYFAKQYVEQHPNEKVKLLKFAASLRDVTEGMFGIPKGDEAAYEAFKAIPSNRKFMVDLGQNLKRVYGEDFFAGDVADTIWNDMDCCDTKDTYIISDFRFPIEFWTLLNAFPDKLDITFCNFQSDRYTIAPEQVSEQMAIWLLDKGIEDRENIDVRVFAELIKEYESIK